MKTGSFQLNFSTNISKKWTVGSYSTIGEGTQILCLIEQHDQVVINPDIVLLSQENKVNSDWLLLILELIFIQSVFPQRGMQWEIWTVFKNQNDEPFSPGRECHGIYPERQSPLPSWVWADQTEEGWLPWGRSPPALYAHVLCWNLPHLQIRLHRLSPESCSHWDKRR